MTEIILEALEARIVGLKKVVRLLGFWSLDGCAGALDLCCPQWASFSVGRVPGCCRTRGAVFFIRHPYYTILCGNCLLIVVIFYENSSAKYRAWRSTWSG